MEQDKHITVHNRQKGETAFKHGDLFSDSCDIIEQSQASAYRLVNEMLVKRNWLLGKRIQQEVLNEQRAEYGEQVVAKLAKALTYKYGKGFTKTNLYNFVSFYQAWPNIFHAVSGKCLSTVDNTCSNTPIRLPWTHYRIILQEENWEARIWYANEAAKEMWGTRTLQRNISSQILSTLAQIAKQRPCKG